MRRVILIFSFFSLLLSICYADDFRKASWGMSIEEVKKTESTEPMNEESNGAKKILVYEGKVASLNCFYGYIFVNDTLVRAKYMFQEKHSNNNDYITDYENINEILEKKYGKPDEDKTLWLNDLYKNDFQHYGMAISIGHLMYYKQWNLDSTKIISMLSGENYQIEHGVEYSSVKFEGREKAVEENKNFDDL